MTTTPTAVAHQPTVKHSQHTDPHLCECGCGEVTAIAKTTSAARGYKKGDHARFVFGHALRVAPRQTIKFCNMADCDKPREGFGLCQKHYTRLKKRGTTDLQDRSLAARFWPKVDAGGPDVCWEWQGAKNPDGYGRTTIDGVAISAHRASMILAGFDPGGFYVLHSCDNPPCVNLAHLRLGSKDDNTRDMVERERQQRGTRHAFAKLTEDKVREIRARVAKGETRTSLGLEFGVSANTITTIHHRKTWKHVQ